MRIFYNILAVIYSIKVASYALYCIKNKEKGRQKRPSVSNEELPFHFLPGRGRDRKKNQRSAQQHQRNQRIQ